jgi:O-6-methylguanine DNA methyltransferase
MVPSGKVTTYGEIAHTLGIKGYQAIGKALKCNPYAPDVPCHRVVRKDGSLGGFKGSLMNEAILEKKRLLNAEGVIFEEGKVDLTKCFFSFSKFSLENNSSKDI